MDRPAEGNTFKRHIPVMGTYLNVTIRRTSAGAAAEIFNELFRYVHELEKQFNVFDPESDLTKLNINKEITASEEFYELMILSYEMSILTDGKFDPTIAPVMKHMGFYKNMPMEILNLIPDDHIENGWENIFLSDPGGVRYVKIDDNVWLDMSGIAKGYIVDRSADMLREKGVNDFIVDAGGDLYCASSDPGDTWNVGIRTPGKNEIIIFLAVSNKSVVTSGDYENWIPDGNGGSGLTHIIDPDKNKPLKKRLSSVTVIADTAAAADALATSMMTMPGDDVISLSEKINDVDVIIVDLMESGYRVLSSSGAEKYIKRGV